MFVGIPVGRALYSRGLITELIKQKHFLRRVPGVLGVAISWKHRYSTAANLSLKRQIRPFHTLSDNSKVSSKGVNLDYLENKKAVDITWDDDERSRFHSMWLRFNCRCSKCISSKGQNWIYPLHDIPMDLTIKDVKITADGSVRVRWNEDDHEGLLTTQYMREHCYSKQNIQRIRDRAAVMFHTDLSIDGFSWLEVQNSDEAFYNWMAAISRKGISLLSNVPTEKNYLRNVLSRIGNMLGTCEGVVMDVIAYENPEHVVLSNKRLEYHQDLAFYEAQPGIQFLHCLRFDEDIKGGETLFIDMFHMAEEFRKTYPEDFHVLLTIPHTYQQIQTDRQDYSMHMVLRRPIFAVNNVDQIIRVSWHPMEQGPPVCSEHDMEGYYRAYHRLANFIDKFPYQRAFRYNAGDMLCFNNRRLAHGRNKFDQSSAGRRHLQGGYLTVEDFLSTMNILATKLGKTPPQCTMGNSDWTR